MNDELLLRNMGHFKIAVVDKQGGEECKPSYPRKLDIDTTVCEKY